MKKISLLFVILSRRTYILTSLRLQREKNTCNVNELTDITVVSYADSKSSEYSVYTSLELIFMSLINIDFSSH